MILLELLEMTHTMKQNQIYTVILYISLQWQHFSVNFPRIDDVILKQ